ncbi:serine/threonine-protein kinase meng-po [Chrysoperla carnea]|uniref:serine/threonine-protein kinase meng-po n=1 Tax=Chrysoperla carnea TaxID=189513 RepID=UPI001D08412E|nr:serine/threonine-protein kinase meng-po [Chrysoperla carnea]
MRRLVKKILEKKKPLTMLVRSISMRLSGRRKKEKDCNGNQHGGKSRCGAGGIERSTTTPAIATSVHSDGGSSTTVNPPESHQTTTSRTSVKHHHSSSSAGAGGGGNIHRIQDLQIPQLSLNEEYEIERILAEGCFAQILLAKHRDTNTTVVLKGVHTELTTVKDFQREYHYSYHLSPHPHILSSYAVCFRADKCLFFAQEYAPLGDLSGCVRSGGLNEKACKEIARQLASALDFMHTKELVHRDLKLENVLVFDAELSKVKLCDFGVTRKEGSLVSKPRCAWPPFVPPELYEVLSNERYHCKAANDTWQLGILIFVCLTGCPPWQSADCIGDLAYASFWRYQKRRVTKIPHQFKRFTPRLLRMFRRMFEHKPEKRSPVAEVNKYLNDAWIDPAYVSQQGSGNCMGTTGQQNSAQVKRADSPQSRDRGSEDAGKTRLKRLLSSYGLETTVDQSVVTKRVWDWVLSCEAHPVVSETNSIDNTSQQSTNCSMAVLPVC